MISPETLKGEHKEPGEGPARPFLPSFLGEEAPAPDNNPTGAKGSTAIAPNAAPEQDPLLTGLHLARWNHYSVLFD